MPERTDRARFQAVQDRHFAEADEAHFRWATEDPAFAPVESEILAPHVTALAHPCLEIGCGEGTNLARLATGGRPVGIDRYVEKARFAARAVPAARLVVADAGALPFPDRTFAGVLVRDLLHHLPEPRGALAEAVRVLAPGGTLRLLEPNGRSPFIRLQAQLVAAERGARAFDPASVAALLDGLPVGEVHTETAEGFPLRRVLLHYRFGWPALGRPRAMAALLARVERIAARLVPRSRWSYVSVRARRR